MRAMRIRHFRRRCALDWLAIVAILLLALAPTVSQVISAHAPVHRHAVAMDGHAGHAGHHAGASGEDCWSKCGYCDFLAHAPVLGAVAQAIALDAVRAAIPVLAPLWQSRHAAGLRVAQPRGPPPPA